MQLEPFLQNLLFSLLFSVAILFLKTSDDTFIRKSSKIFGNPRICSNIF